MLHLLVTTDPHAAFSPPTWAWVEPFWLQSARASGGLRAELAARARSDASGRVAPEGPTSDDHLA